jgi:hypothetical protein
MMSVRIKAEYNQPIKMKPVNKSGSALGTPQQHFDQKMVGRAIFFSKANCARR